MVVAPVDDDDQIEVDDHADDISDTDPEKCTVSGNGLTSATTRKLTKFVIRTHSSEGAPRRHGGDTFVVAIRGRGESVRAKVVDVGDGTYEVEYRPVVSGRYQIGISTGGVALPGSPFLCVVSTPTASAPHCILRGAALLRATARKEEHFDIQFRDALGQVAHAEDLDVYVNTIPEAELALLLIAKQEEEAMREREREEAAAAEKSSKKKDGRDAMDRDKAEKEKTSAFHVPPKHASRPLGGEGLAPLVRTHECTVTSPKPLVVRASRELDSPCLGQLMPGQRLKLLEVVLVDEADGQKSARASVALVDDSEDGPEIPCHHNWRDLFAVRPSWLENVPTPRKAAPPSARFLQMPFGDHQRARPRPSRHRPQPPAAVPPQDGGLNPIGWVTVNKGSRELVTPRGQLPAGDRQRHMQQWARRLAIDRTLAVSSQKKPQGPELTSKQKRQNSDGLITRAGGQSSSIYTDELSSDPKGIGFAFGGVDPGRLHARGHLVETHKVHYSIAMCGTYRLHVGLRHEGIELPGSPFLLEVTAGPASALSTRVSLPQGQRSLHGVVGPAGGCEILLHACDKMGNLCSAGGAHVTGFCTPKDKHVESHVRDNKDGTYLVMWRSTLSGSFEAHVTIDGLDVLGSPTPMKLISDKPDLEQTELTGSGLVKAVAGKVSTYKIKCNDQFGNPADPRTALSFEMALLRVVEGTEKISSKTDKANVAERWQTAKPLAHETIFGDEEIQINYTPTIAGNLELHVWAVPLAGPERGVRQALPSSPCLMHSVAGKAHAHGSKVDGFSRVEAVVDRTGKGGGASPARAPVASGAHGAKRSPIREAKCRYEESKEIFAGDSIVVKPKIRDRLGNNTAAPEGALSMTLELPDGQQLELKASMSIRSGLTTYDVQYEAQQKGWHALHVRLNRASIAGSPVKFECIPSLPFVSKSSYTLPTDSPALVANKNYKIAVVTRDRCGNQLEHGGAAVQGRLQSANLPPQQDALLEVEDNGDGTYFLNICLKAASDLKVIISIDKERQGEGGGEFAPIPMSFCSTDTINKMLAKLAKQQASGEQQAIPEGASGLADLTIDSPSRRGSSCDQSSPAHSSRSSRGNMDHPFSGSDAGKQKWKEAGSTVVQGFGKPDERRDRVPAMAVVVGMAKEATKSEVENQVNAKRSCGSASLGTSSFGSVGTAMSSIGSNGEKDSLGGKHSIGSSQKRTPRADPSDAKSASPKRKGSSAGMPAGLLNRRSSFSARPPNLYKL